jgi:hypothetical protein
MRFLQGKSLRVFSLIIPRNGMVVWYFGLERCMRADSGLESFMDLDIMSRGSCTSILGVLKRGRRKGLDRRFVLISGGHGRNMLGVGRRIKDMVMGGLMDGIG